jgi:hypothetical protein
MAINDIINDSWQGHTHGEVEQALKDKIQELTERMDNLSPGDTIGYNQLSSEVKQLLTKAQNALQPTDIAEWVKAANKPSYSAAEIGGVEGFANLLAKLQAMDTAIAEAGGGSSTVPDAALSDTSENAVQNKVIKAAIDSLRNALDTLIGSGNVQGVIDTFNEVKAFLDGIDTSDPTLANQLLALNNAISALQNTLSTKANSADVVPNSRTINGKALSSNVTIGMSDIPGLNEAIAGAGSVKSVSVNGTNHAPNSNGVVDLGNIQGEKGEKGDTGSVQVDGNGNVLIYNGRDMTTPGAALDASQGQYIGKMLNTNDNKFYKVWVGTQTQLDALEGDYDDDTIYLVGTVPTVAQRFDVTFNGTKASMPSGTPDTVKEGSAFSVTVSPQSGCTIDTATGTMVGGSLAKAINQDGTVTFSTSSVTGNITITASASVHIAGITVSKGTRIGNGIPLTAAVSPNGAENVTLAWSVSDTDNFSITDNGNGSATLNILSGASDADVSVTCADSNSASGTAQGTLHLTGLSYDATIPTTEITDINATRTAANTLTLAEVADGNTHTGTTFALAGTVPTVKTVVRTTTTKEVEGETVTTTTHTLADVPAVAINGNTLVYKGDCQVTVIATASVGGQTISKTKVIDITHNSADQIWFEDIETLKAVRGKSIGSASGNVLTRTDNDGGDYAGCVTYAQAAAVSAKQALNLGANTSVVAFNEFKWFTGATVVGTGSSARANLSGCTNLEYIELPSTLTSLGGITTTKLKKIVIPPSVTLADSNFKNMATLEEVELYCNALRADIFNGCSSLRSVIFGENISAMVSNVFRNCTLTNLELTMLRTAGLVEYDSSSATIGEMKKIYVPSALVEQYKASSWGTSKNYVSGPEDIVAIPEEGGGE